MGDEAERANRERAQQAVNMGQDPGPMYADLKAQYEDQQRRQQNSSDASCFTRDTKVLTSLGWKPISEIRRNDTVLSYSVKEGSFVERKVLKLKEHSNQSQIWEIRLSRSKEVLRTTRAHSFHTKRGWLKTDELIEGDVVSYLDNEGAISNHEVVSVKSTADYCETFNLVTFGENNYVVPGAIAHNFTYLRRVRSFVTNLVHWFWNGLSSTENDRRKLYT